MEYGKLLNSLPDTLKSKYINAEWSKLFNSVCLKENLWPSYTNMFLMLNKRLIDKIMYIHIYKKLTKDTKNIFSYLKVKYIIFS